MDAGVKALSEQFRVTTNLLVKAIAGLDGAALLTLHEGYHVGQLGFPRKWLGHSALLD